MRLLIQQSFPLGRFHANPWRAFTFDDPYGEWPPSPWRLLRAILARSFQLSRELPVEMEAENEQHRETLVRAFCASAISWHLPTNSWRGPGVQQYQPADFEYSNPKPQKLDVYEYNEAFRNAALEFAASIPDTFRFITIYKKEKKNVVEFFSEEMELAQQEQDVSAELIKRFNGHIKAKRPTPRKYKRYFSDAKTYTTTKVKDNFWLTPANTSPLVWIIGSNHSLWTDSLLAHLDACLARMTYFGRAESITNIERIQDNGIAANCILRDSRTATAVPVLCPTPDATFPQVACMTNEDAVANTTMPPGAVWKYAERPAVTKAIKPRKPRKELAPASVLQFAVGGRVFPPLKSWIRITEKFRGVVLRKISQLYTDNAKAEFSKLPPNIRAQYSLLSGKDENCRRLSGHRHIAFFLIPDEGGKPSRLICYRKEPFTSEEQNFLLAAAAAPLDWDFKPNDWWLRLVPLAKETPLPSAKDVFGVSRVWESLTPYVPPLHVFRGNGKPKPGAEVETQLQSHLDKFELPNARFEIFATENEPVQWVKVHRPRRTRDGQANDDKRGYRIRIVFPEPVQGPLFFGHSSHFGLGLFAPFHDKDNGID